MVSGKASGSNGGVPTSSKKMIQSLKEIVNFPEAEIYSMLKECNMDPNEAVNRLLSQDPFHKVKSKREKKKENKDVGDSRSRTVSSTSTRGSRSGTDRYSSRSNVAQYGISEIGATRGKAAYKKESRPDVYTSPAIAMAGNNVNRRQSPFSEASTEKTFYSVVPESIAVVPPSYAFQSAWSGMPGQVSMADIVKMGRPQGKANSALTTSQQHVNNQHALGSSAFPNPHDIYPSQKIHAAKVLEVNSGMSGHVPPNDDWHLEEEPPAESVSAVEEPAAESEAYGDPCDRTKQQFRSQSDDIRFEDDIVDNMHASNPVRSIPDSNQIIEEDNPGSTSGCENDFYQDISTYEGHHQEVEDPNASVQSVNDNFQRLSLPKKDEDAPSEDDGPAVKIPDHLQVQSSECSHLSFGSFGSGMTASLSFGSRAVQSNEEAAVSDASCVGHPEASNGEYYAEESLKTTPDVTTGHRIGGSSVYLETPSVSQAIMLKQEAAEVGQANQYCFPSSTANFAFENNQQSFVNSQTSCQMQGLPSLTGVMPYSNTLPSTLLASSVQPLREAELAYSPFPISQSMASKYGNSVSSISGPAASMAEALKTGNFSASQTTQSLPGGSNSGGAGLPQHMAMHPYSQPSVPMGHFAAANMIGYPFLPQSYTYMPSAFQQAFAAGNSTYPQSLAAAMLPQYKNSASVSSLPQAAAVASGYGPFGNFNSIPNNFPVNPPSATAGTSMNYDDILSSQYKDASHLLPLQQGPGSRTLSGVPGSTYYNSFQGQNQQPAGFRQSQQPSQHYGPLSGVYPNLYHSQSGLSLDHQQQMSRDGSQGQPPKQTQQIWQNSY